MIIKSIRWRLQLWLAFLLVCTLTGFGIATYEAHRLKQYQEVAEHPAYLDLLKPYFFPWNLIYTEKDASIVGCILVLNREFKRQSTANISTLYRLINRKLILGCDLVRVSKDSGGLGRSFGFELKKVLYFCHSSFQADTVVTVEQKVEEL